MQESRKGEGSNSLHRGRDRKRDFLGGPVIYSKRRRECHREPRIRRGCKGNSELIAAAGGGVVVTTHPRRKGTGL